MEDIHGTWALLQDRREHLRQLRTAEHALFATGYGAMSAKVGAEADDLEATVFWLPVECMLGPERHSFEVSVRPGDPVTGVSRGICGPCVAKLDRAVAAMNAEVQ
jgi:hypothetical protein